MKRITSMDEMPITLNAEQVAQVLGISRAKAYTLMHMQDFPTIKIDKRIMVRKDHFLAWLENRAMHS